MIAATYFNYQEILKKGKLVDKKIDLKSPNSKYLKKFPYTSFGAGFLLMMIVWLCTLVGVVWGEFALLDSIFTAIFVFLLVSFLSFCSLMKKVDLFSYQKLKKSKKRKYQVYECKARIDGIYESTGVSINTNMKEVKETKSKNYILMVNFQKIHIHRKVYEDIRKDKFIKLYIAKIGDMCVLFDYEKV